MVKISTLSATLLAGIVRSDMYLHFPGGSNNRLSEAGRNVANQNRLFDSQNNNRFGYNQAGQYFYEGSVMDMQWTVQHGCGPDSNVECTMVVQYACGDALRDGRTTDTVPSTSEKCANGDCSTDFEYGMHEDFDYYKNCALRERNHGLFKADRNLQGTNARYTRQDQNGNRFGYECNEERDYYPYWTPTIWRDIVVMVDDESHCDRYLNYSENTENRTICQVSKNFIDAHYTADAKDYKIPINREACLELSKSDRTSQAEWVTVPGHGIDKPDCILNDYQRDNHHGNANSRYFAGYKWTIPQNIASESCTLRVRYNITSSEVRFEDDITKDINTPAVYEQFGMDAREARTRGYQLRNDPLLQIFPDFGLKLRMAFNTDQVGRVFEDRSHIFAIRKLPHGWNDYLEANEKKLYNVNVHGKIGNFVEVYPAFEYDYNPQRLQVNKGDLVHIQWTGSNTNNGANDGSHVDDEGNTLTEVKSKDRSNLALVDDAGSWSPNGMLDPFGLWQAAGLRLATSGVPGGDNEYVQAAGSYFDLGLIEMGYTGKWSFMSTRNTRFGVRSQKGKVIVI